MKRKTAGYTLVEILIATALSLMLLGAVVQMFGDLGTSVSRTRSILESTERLRMATARLKADLEGVTVKMVPPRDPADGEGYFEYIEGPAMQFPLTTARTAAQYNIYNNPTAPNTPSISGLPVNTENPSGTVADSSAGDTDDILLFTTRSKSSPFVGLYTTAVATNSVQSDVAEVAWFLRGNTLYRRALLVRPDLPLTAANFYRNNDISARLDGANPVPNSLGDLTRRECRFGHETTTYPFRCNWGQYGLPTLHECSDSTWTIGRAPAAPGTPKPQIDLWSNAKPDALNTTTARWADTAIITAGGGTPNGTRVSEDVILTNVIGFDVKAWDPLANAYEDLGYLGNNTTTFSGYGNPQSQLQGGTTVARVYDTWSSHYETTLGGGVSSNGFDDAGFDETGAAVAANGVVDDITERQYPPPYSAPLRGVQVKIRIFEPESQQVREMTVIQDFLPR